MKTNLPLLIMAIGLLIGITGISAAMKATKQKTLSENENDALRQQVENLKNRTVRKRPNPADTAKIRPLASGGTNELVTLQDSGTDTERQQDRPQRESFADRVARMKEEDPEGYAEMVKRREEMQQTMKYNLAQRTATIMDLDTTNMTDAEREAHEQLIAQMGTIWDLTAQIQTAEGGMDREAMGELFNQARETRPLMEQERTTMLRILGTDLGYKGQESTDFAKHIEDIISATTIQMPRGGGRSGPGGGGDGGGGSRGGSVAPSNP